MLRLGITGALALAAALCAGGCASENDSHGDAALATHQDAATSPGMGTGGGPGGSSAGTGGAPGPTDAAVQHDAATQHDAGGHHDAGPQDDAGTPHDSGSNQATDAGDAGPSGPLIVYAGSYGSQIDIFRMDPDTLALTPAGNAATDDGPSFLAFDAQRHRLVAGDENADTIESFTIAPDTGALTRVDGESSNGSGPAHVTFDQSGNWVFAANYNGGSVAVLAIAADGSLSPATTTVMPGMNAHEVVLNAANTVAYVPCLGSDHVAIYDFNAGSGALTPRTPVDTANGAGPRHFALSPDGAHAWLMNEKNSTVTSFTVAGDGALTPGATISSLPNGFNGDNTGAEIAVHPSGKWVYASNRGHDSIAVFEVGNDGALTLVANTPTGGEDPRHFSLVPGGAAMLVANQTSGTIHGFHVDPDTGLLSAAGELTSIDSVSFVQAVQLP